MTSKLHGVCHNKGGPLRLHLSKGQCSDFTGADGVLKDLPPAAMVMEDKGYDSDKIRKMLVWQGTMPCIPPRRCRKKPVHYSKRLDRKGHKIENLFSRLKDGGSLQPATTAVPTSSVLPSSWPPLASSDYESSSAQTRCGGSPARSNICPIGIWSLLKAL